LYSDWKVFTEVMVQESKGSIWLEHALRYLIVRVGAKVGEIELNDFIDHLSSIGAPHQVLIIAYKDIIALNRAEGMGSSTF